MMQKKAALITGASGGIGYELARLFAEDNYDLVIVARNESRLQQVAQELRDTFGVAVKVLAKDLEHPTAPDEIFQELQNEQVSIQVLVNNAGFGSFGRFAESDLKTTLSLLQVNMVALTHLTNLLLPEMLKKREGRILNVASAAAFAPGPLLATYHATKAYVLLFSEALKNELEGTGVTVTVLCPGATATSFQERANLQALQGGMMDAKTVARIGYRSLMQGKVLSIPGMANRIMVQAIRFVPRTLIVRIVRSLYPPR